jgi:hypothetical protein
MLRDASQAGSVIYSANFWTKGGVKGWAMRLGDNSTTDSVNLNALPKKELIFRRMFVPTRDIYALTPL